jgi:hypothetical protein
VGRRYLNTIPLGQPQMWVPEGDPQTTLVQIPRDDCILTPGGRSDSSSHFTEEEH